MSTNDFEERVVTVPLRDAKEKPVQQRADYAMKITRQHLAQHFSVDEDDVIIDGSVNEAVWTNGRQNPPSTVRVRAARFVEDGEPVVEAEHAE
ncbi:MULTISPECIES: 50S ribosomal protein L31e [Halorubrum]|uniref:Large ribosomal subunit protein eL31 n=1 Tax=Halorubrum sodomense TaxID=35743 RepID=A0A1I6H650_HALSD|nr:MULTISPECIES: 50S ribosomal protein L31e [Halorubrum]TKX55729.1 50S ribosomal protein L31e [Halorubrum sp. SP3]TKX71487.1 50S ribosomal protein L31e [Halorubrum sp. SP9]SFR49953.1 large subunit ribosomal protein L31e [Halorubrum sodomense]